MKVEMECHDRLKRRTLFFRCVCRQACACIICFGERQTCLWKIKICLRKRIHCVFVYISEFKIETTCLYQYFGGKFVPFLKSENYDGADVNGRIKKKIQFFQKQQKYRRHFFPPFSKYTRKKMLFYSCYFWKNCGENELIFSVVFQKNSGI